MLSRNHLRGLATLLILVAASPGPAAAFQLPWAQKQARPVTDQAQVVQVQAADPQLMTLQEEIRKLNGRLEELNFQIMQMQDQMRRMQEDTEFRFQELEGGGGGGQQGAAKVQQRSERIIPPSEANQQTAAAAVPPAPAATAPVAAAPAQGNPQPPAPQAGGGPELGAPPTTLGTITFDQNGNVVSSGAGQPVDLLRGTPAGGGTDGAVVAALPHSNDPEEIYQSAYQFILSGDYKTAEAGFKQYLDMFPDGQHAADANFWLGEAMLGQDRYREAAEVFLNGNRQFPKAGKAPEMLLKLGVSLAAMNQRDVACATYTEIGHRYPDVSSALKERVKQEQALAGC